MKALRVVLFLAGLSLIVWGEMDYVRNIPSETNQAFPKIILGLLAVLASRLAKRPS